MRMLLLVAACVLGQLGRRSRMRYGFLKLDIMGRDARCLGLDDFPVRRRKDMMKLRGQWFVPRRARMVSFVRPDAQRLILKT